MSTTFKLKCVGCQMVEQRPASEIERDDVPYCKKCLMPMTVQSVTTKNERKAR